MDERQEQQRRNWQGGRKFVSKFFFSSRRRHTRYWRDWSSDVCSSDLPAARTAVIGLACVASYKRTRKELKNLGT